MKLIIVIIIVLIIYNYNKKSKLERLSLNPDYTGRRLIDIRPNFKLDAYCINLRNKHNNMLFINKEWSNFLNVKRFIALDTASKSHYKILTTIWNNRNTIKFPIVIIEDDVFRRNNFTKYWNELKNIDNADYVAFDAFFLKPSKYQDGINKHFISLLQHRMMGFTVYYKRFFDRFNTPDDIAMGGGPIDMVMTHNESLIKLTPNEQVVRQIVSKMSSTANSTTNKYLDYYKIAEDML